MDKINPYLVLAGRIMLALMFVLTGFHFLQNYQWALGILATKGIPGLLLAPTIALLIGAGTCVIIGWQTRVAALALAAFTLLAGSIYHNQIGDPNDFNHLMKNISMAGGLLCLVRFGAGEFSLDNRRRR